MKHSELEKKGLLMAILVIILVSIGGLVEITPLFFLKSTIPPLEGVRAYTPLELEGRDIYLKEGCYNCHSQMIRPFRAETVRYGPYSKPAESRYDHPFQWGSKRTGPDLARVGGKYPDSWHVQHMKAPRSLVPESVMPNYPWLEKNDLDYSKIQRKMRALRTVGVPYTDEQIARATEGLKGKTELDALIAYLQMLGTAVTED